MGIFNTSSRCMHCRKPLLRCGGRCWDTEGEPEKEKARVKGKDGRTRTVTRNTGRMLRRGVLWCSCGCRVIDDRCTNVTCSTRR